VRPSCRSTVGSQLCHRVETDKERQEDKERERVHACVRAKKKGSQGGGEIESQKINIEKVRLKGLVRLRALLYNTQRK